ncbi:MAG: hypothetical protein EHM23_04055 [Acidobacteria bacterium]|nr:MAG: hypothetical protein EHM23_04055 [Acidobacteriota bacterium]
MSDFTLTIGRITDRSREIACVTHLASLGLVRKRLFRKPAGEYLEWMEAAPDIDELCLLNLASVVCFLEHVARLEGFPDVGVATEKTRFKHLPWYMDSIWLPVPMEMPKVPLMLDGGWPVFLGSAVSLHSALTRIREMSDAGLGSTPEGYDLMRTNVKSFYRTGISVVPERAVLQWVWKGLHDGVECALEHHAPMAGLGL